MKISDNDIKKICSEGIYKRGCEYFKESRVHIRTRAEDNIVAAVDGDKVYNVHIGFDEDGNITDTFCTCPYFQTMSSNCKHIVATLKTRQTELSQGEKFEDSNDAVASKLCDEFEQINGKKTDLHLGFIFNINTNYRRECSFSMSIRLGNNTASLSGTENFIDAYITGKEYKLSKHKSYTNARYAFGAYEEHILAILAEAYQNKTAASSFYTPKLTASDFGSLTAKRILPLLKGADCRFFINGMPYPNIMIKSEDPDILIDVTATDAGINISVPQCGLALIPDGSWFIYDGDIYETTEEWRSWFMPIYNALASEDRTQVDFRGNNSVSFAANVLPSLRNRKGVVTQGIEDIVVSEKPEFDVYFDRLDDGITAVIIANYGNVPIRLPDEEKSDKIIVRDYTAEHYLLSFFGQFELFNKTLYLNGDADMYEFFENGWQRVSELARVHESDSFKGLLPEELPKIWGHVSYNTSIDLLEVGFESEISPAEIMGILSAIRNKKSYYRMANGTFLKTSEESPEFDLLNNLDFSFKDIQNRKKQVSRYHALYLDGLKRSGIVETDSGFDDFIEAIVNIRATIPDYLDVVLRDYQKTGVHWLKQLSELGFGGILADDMGLGKTLEVIAFVMSEEHDAPALVVTPSALTYNWLSEIYKFAPKARAKVIDGPKEARIKEIGDISGYDFIITSYPMLRRDIAEYSMHTFSYCFIDEAQNIKNPKTLSAKAVKKIHTNHCFALSGTPIENSLTELWSIFDFVMPSYLESHQQFVQYFEKPILQGKDGARAETLRRKIKPFVLRRMKYEVLSELPEKIENTFYAELDTQQKKLYSAYLSVAKHEAKELLAYGGDNMRILSLLMRLRQICCHPKLIDESYEKDSGKLNLLEELVESAMAAEHRVLIFSQFTSMLGIIKSRLDELGIAYFYLDGKTPSHIRTELADRFNNGEKSVFLVSLKAGGTGLNLIGADTVIHYDPWWNPAAVDQASDRAYRIGQKKAVHVIRLATRGTIEEQILKLQDKKRSLAEDMIRTNSAMLSNLTKDEILSLFK